MHTNPLRHPRVGRGVSRAAAAQQFHLYLTSPQPSPGHGDRGPRCGQRLARLIAHDIRVVQTFDDHAWVIGRLWDSGEVETLFRVAASGLLHGLARELYRLAIELWLRQ
ncbi:MAG: hypothetical protein ABW067_15735 [Rhizobacter sp.]